MRAKVFYVDAFTARLFSGNPAAVMPLEGFPADDLMQSIAAENNLSETAFVVKEGANYRLRWFTPIVEVPLCGHATLASAAVVMQRLEPERLRVVFRLNKTELRAYQASPRGGEMVCRLAGDRVELQGSCVFYLEGEVEV